MIGHNMNEPRGFCAKKNKPDTKKEKYHMTSIICEIVKEKNEETENKRDGWKQMGRQRRKDTCQQIRGTGKCRGHVQHDAAITTTE